MLSSNAREVSKELLMKSFIGIHSFTGCDTVSALNGRGKVIALNLMVKNVLLKLEHVTRLLDRL